MRHLALAPLFACLTIGCHEEKHAPVASTGGGVTVDGQPVQHGYVVFIPDRASGTVGPPARAVIIDGTFSQLSTYADKDGAVVGRHRVQIYAFDSPEEGAPQRLPPRFNTATTLTATVLDVERNWFDLHLHTTPTATTQARHFEPTVTE